jgi:hypothetical protein
VFRLDWANPKISLGEFHSYLGTLLGVKFDGLVEDQGYVYISTFEPLNGSEENAITEYVCTLNNLPRSTIITSQPDPAPFALPTFRTKRNATASHITVASNSDEEIQFLLTSERYVSGGDLIVENAEFGDYITAEVEDIDGVIPEAYRAALCEAWPVVSSYIEKEYVRVATPGSVQAGSVTTHSINTYPLNAKITAGLYLCIHYYAVNSGLSRRLVVNYHLTKKL